MFEGFFPDDSTTTFAMVLSDEDARQVRGMIQEGLIAGHNEAQAALVQCRQELADSETKFKEQTTGYLVKQN